ncbi:MAG: RHS repeat-associated core domain-containing protein [Simkaniaceae bacterium]|nr:RHS repeat-associated core domain-containing protein [Simkaniaceae bacterium]MCF7852734.1 RHS repeat-associated core domain-containing protein [Simkaniaceae bacterium]
MKSITTDSKGRIQKNESKDLNGIVLQSTEITYNDNEKRADVKSHVFSAASDPVIQVVRYVYTDSGKLKQTIRALGTNCERVTTFDYDENDRLVKVCLPSGVLVFREYDVDGNLILLKSSDKTVDYAIVYSEDGHLLKCIDRNMGYSIKREFTLSHLLAKETFPTGHTFAYSYNDNGQIEALALANFGSVQYKYDNAKLASVSRLSANGALAYTHHYEWNKTSNYLVQEKIIAGLGEVSYAVDPTNKLITQQNLYNAYELILDDQNGIASIKENGKRLDYSYDKLGHLILDDKYDSLGNPISGTVNVLNELSTYRDVECEYDLNGNLIVKKTPEKTYFFKYDALGRLISAKTENFEAKYTYDIFNRRLFKTISSEGKTKTYAYLYQNDTEVAVLDSKQHLVVLRVLGLSPIKGVYKSISVEKSNAIYAPVYDYACHIRKLVNIATQEVIDYSSLHCYGQNIRDLKPIIPWVYSTQHYDSETQLIYYGDRYYDPSIRRWTTPDPLGEIDSANPYLFVHNNPIKYMDIRGDFALTVPILVWGARGASLAVPGLAPLVWGATAGIAAYQAGKHIKNHMDKKKEGRQHDGTPGDHERQNDQFKDACKEIERKLGRKLSEKDVRRLHNDISKKDYGYHEIVEEGYWKFK